MTTETRLHTPSYSLTFTHKQHLDPKKGWIRFRETKCVVINQWTVGHRLTL